MTKTFLMFLAAMLAMNCAAPTQESSSTGRVFLDTIVTNAGKSIRLSAISNSDTTVLLKFKSGEAETIIDTLDQRAAIFYIKAIDFDTNGSADILGDYFGNNSSYFLYLYDSSASIFRNIDNYLNFPDGQQLETNRQVYYSYEGAGCADLNWVSDLFTIRNFKIIHLAHLAAEGCDGEDQGISVHQIIDNNSDSTLLFETLPYSGEQNNSKGLIKKYWNKHYTSFLKLKK